MRLTYHKYRLFVYALAFSGFFFHLGMFYKENQIAKIFANEDVRFTVEIIDRPFGLKGLKVTYSEFSEEEQILEALKALSQ